MEHVNGWCFRGIYNGGLWEDDLHVSARKELFIRFTVCAFRKLLSVYVFSYFPFALRAGYGI